MEQIKICSNHRVKAEWKTGKSKSTNKDYAFWACPEKNNGEFCKAEIIDPPDSEEWCVYEREIEKSRRIERQHSQDMAIEFLKLRLEVDPDSFKKAIEKTDLKSMVKTYTDYFADDINEKDLSPDEVTYEPIDDAEIERISKAIGE